MYGKSTFGQLPKITTVQRSKKFEEYTNEYVAQLSLVTIVRSTFAVICGTQALTRGHLSLIYAFITVVISELQQASQYIVSH